MSDNLSLRAYITAAVFFCGILVAGILLYSEMADNYDTVIPESMTKTSGLANDTIDELESSMNESLGAIQRFTSGDILGVVDAVKSVPSLLWGITKVAIDIPTMILSLIGGEEIDKAFPGLNMLFTIAWISMMIYVVFKFVSLIFKRD